MADMDFSYTEDGTGANKLESVVTIWGIVQEENRKDAHLVDKEQLKAWKNLDRETTAKLTTVIDAYDGLRLTPQQEVVLDQVVALVKSARRKSSEELLAEAAEERLRRLATREAKDAEKRRKSALTGFKKVLHTLLKK